MSASMSSSAVAATVASPLSAAPSASKLTAVETSREPARSATTNVQSAASLVWTFTRPLLP